MTEEMKTKLKKAHEEELADVTKYCEMAEQCCDRHAAGILKDIAYEEKTHANLIAHILDMEGQK